MERRTVQISLAAVLFLALGSWSVPAAQFNTDFNSGAAPPGSTLAGNAFVDTQGGLGNSGVLKLTINAGGQQGAFYINDIAGGVAVTNLKVLAKVAIGGGTARPADGMAFSYGTDLSAPPATFGEEGVGTGISVTFDTWDNNGDDTAPAIDVRYGGAILAFQAMATNGPGNQPFREGARDPAGPILTNSAGGPVSLQTLGPGGAPPDGSFVDLIIELFPDNTLSVSWSNVVVFDHLPLPSFTPISGGTIAFGARTGGATEDHWIDNLQIFANFVTGPATIVSQPTNRTVLESQRATFSIEVGGTPPFTVQWFSNNVAIPGANQLSYTTPPATEAMNGTVYRAEVSNPQNATPVVSANATLTVQSGLILQSASSRTTATNVFVVYNKPAARTGTYTLNPAVTVLGVRAGTSSNEVILDVAPLTLETSYTLSVTGETGTDGSALQPSPSTARFHYGFGAFCHDFNDDMLPPGTVLGGAAAISSNFVHLTDAAQIGVCGAFWIPDQVAGSPLDRLQVRWSSLVGNGVGGGADGYSFNWAPDLPSPVSGCYGSEEGAGSGLSVTVDTFDNGAAEAPGVEIKWQGTRVAFAAIPKDNPGNDVYLRKATFVDASVEVLPNGTATVNYDGTIISAALPGFTSISGGNFYFVGRTGGASDDQWIDNLRINCFSLGPPIFTQQPGNTNIIEGDTATFTAAADGAPPLTLQWFTNGVPVPGAVTSRYTTPVGTPALSGLRVSVVASNQFGATSSSEAILTVTAAPRVVRCFTQCAPNIIHIVYTKPVALDGTYSVDVTIVNGVSYGANQSEVLLDVDPLSPGATATVTIQDVHDLGGNVQFPNPTSCPITYGFASFCADFNDNVAPTNTTLGGVAAFGNNGVLHLTDDGMNGVCGSFYIPDQNSGAPLDRLQVRWKSLIGGIDQAGEATQFGTGGADGYSLSWGTDVTSACGGGPEGVGSGLSVTVDTFDNGGGEAPGIEMKWRGTRVAFSPAVPGDQTAAKAFLRKGQFVDAEVVVSPSGAATFTYDGITISATLPNFAPIAGGNFLFASSTGGAQDNHWIDDLCINGFTLETPGIITQPSDLTLSEGETASFRVVASGLPPFSYQWLQNGAPISGATNPTYSRVVAPADNGTTYSVQISNECGGPVTSRAAALIVLVGGAEVVRCFALCESNIIHVIYSSPVQLDGTYTLSSGVVRSVSYGSNQTEVLVHVDSLPLNTPLTLTIRDVHDQASPPGFVQPNPSVCQFTAGFGGACWDFNNNTAPPGTSITGTASVGGAVGGNDGILHLTDAHTNSACGAFFIADRNGGAPLDRLLVKWKSRVGGGDAGADGYSFNWAPDLTPGTCGGAEEGTGNGLSVTVDTFDNGADIPGVDVVGIEIKWKGQRVASLGIPKDDDGSGRYLRKDQFVDANVIVTPSGEASFTYDGHTINATLPGFAPITAGNFSFVARTGGANDNQWIDDLCINGAPLLTCSNVMICASCTGPLTPVAYGVSSVSICGGPATIVCEPPAGSAFPVGETNVTCTATDGLGQQSRCTFIVKIMDTAPPMIMCPADIVAECNGTGGTPVTYAVTVIDACGGAMVTNCTPASGSRFPRGQTTVNCLTRDGAGNQATCSFNVTVRDRVAPILQCPNTLRVDAVNQAGAIVNFNVTSIDVCDGAVPVRCTPESGSTFPLGTNTVTCTGTDAGGQIGTCSFLVIVATGDDDDDDDDGGDTVRQRKRDCLRELRDLRQETNNKERRRIMADAIDHLRASLEPDQWIDGNHVKRRRGDDVFKEEKRAVRALSEIKNQRDDLPRAVESIIQCIVKADRRLARIAIRDANDVRRKKIRRAREEIQNGDDQADRGRYVQAVESYRQAWNIVTQVGIRTRGSGGGGGMNLELVGDENTTYTIEVSNNLVDWKSLGTVTTDDEGVAKIRDRDADKHPTRFYRLLDPDPEVAPFVDPEPVP